MSYLGQDIKKLGFGLMRLPKLDENTIDVEQMQDNLSYMKDFTAINYLTLYGDKASALQQENRLVLGHGRKRADQCVKCGKCEAVCPQHIAIREHLDEVCAKLLAD